MPMRKIPTDRFSTRSAREMAEKLLDEKQLLNEGNKRPNTMSPNYSSSQISDILGTKNKIKEAILKLNRYEKILMEKEHKLASQQQEFKSVLHAFAEQKQVFDIEKEEMNNNREEYEKKTYELEKKFVEFRVLRDEFEDEKSKFEIEREEIQKIKEITELNYKESEKVYQVTSIKGQKISDELTHIEEVSFKIEEQWDQLNKKEEELSKLQAKLNFQDEDLKNAFEKLDIEKKALNDLKDNIKEESLMLMFQQEELEKKKVSVECKIQELNSFRISSNISENKELDHLYNKLKEQIEVYNQEISIKELRLLKEQKKIKENSEYMIKTYQDLKLIQFSLENSKAEIKDFYKNIVSEFEEMFSKVSKISDNLSEKSGKLDELLKKFAENIIDVAGTKETEDFSPRNQGSDKPIEYFYDLKEIDELTKELISKLKIVNFKEKLLDKERNKYKSKFLELKKAKDTIKRNNEEIISGKEKMKIQLYHLEQGVKSLTSKENELKFIQQELDKRINLLKIKENHIELRSLQLRDNSMIKNA
ncbi:hypothetical protein SteCoe_13925 [Stentor coeruleus]|uniref:Uncharacterized protein n=1 Tax=Stentor coeruleus TaxID=5963 RepID=A0A1R2C772_9CILI|nr:hypothetical protein SteCoe_13925 [Stentor coeruleus]